jgi:phosphoserine phosphatase RsbU/P
VLRPKSLQQKMMLFLLLPVAMLLSGMGWFRFTYARDSLLKEWQEAAVLKLQRAAHHVDMRLSEPELWIRIFSKAGGGPGADAIQQLIVQQLEHMPGVESASIIRVDDGGPPVSPSHGPMMMGIRGSMMFQRAEITQVTSPRYDTEAGHDTVSIISDLLNASSEKVGQLLVEVRFDYLIQNALSYGWNEGEIASLIDDQGKTLACSASEENRRPCPIENVFKVVLKAMKEKPSGTIMGEPSLGGEVVGFYRLKEAPWTLVLSAQDTQILAPINRFRNAFLITGALFTLFILILIRSVAGRTVASIREVSCAAQRVAEGDYQVQLPVESNDEVGQLVRSFNAMVSQLEERMRLKQALDLAMEVQQNLLPLTPPELGGLDIAGTCAYCDETGGDYYDFLQFSELGEGRIGLAVGDVAGHGISAALLMATARAMIRTRILQPGSLAQVVNDVNQLLCYDTERTGDFMTLFLATFDITRQELYWVRAGHAPAIIYDWHVEAFEELRGEGFALGFDNAGHLKEYRYGDWSSTKLLFIGTDGIWETENPRGEQFGMERLRGLLRRHCLAPAQQIIDAVLAAVRDFRETKAQEDDITMVILKSRKTECL